MDNENKIATSKSNIKMINQFLIVYVSFIIVLSILSISASYASPSVTQKPTDQSYISYTDDGASQEAATIPAETATLNPSALPSKSPTPKPTPKPSMTPSNSPITSETPLVTMPEIILAPSPTPIITTQAPAPTKSSMSQVLLALLTILSFVGVITSLGLLIANKLKRRRIRPYVIALLVSLGFFILSALSFVNVG